MIAGKYDMLHHLLALGSSPNILPLAAPTPHITAIASCDPPNLDAYDIIAQHPRTNFNLRTTLYFATTRLDINKLATHLDSVDRCRLASF
jgi:hypothetical protein